MAIFGVRGLCLVLNLSRISEKNTAHKVNKEIKKKAAKK